MASSETTITYTHAQYHAGTLRGLVVRDNTNKRDYVVLENTVTVLTVAPWNWISRVILWNPCNTLGLAVGAFDD